MNILATFSVEGVEATVVDLEDATDYAQTYVYDCMVLEGDSRLVRTLRGAGVRHPLIIVADADDYTRADCVAALNAGADDYLSSTVHPDELWCRIQAVARRSGGLCTSTIVTGNITVNLTRREVLVSGAVVPLTGSEFKVVEALALKKESTLSKALLFDILYVGGDGACSDKIVDVFVCKVRTKLAAAGAGRHIHTIWGQGYSLRDEDAPEPRGNHRTLYRYSVDLLATLYAAKGLPTLGLMAALPGVNEPGLRDAISRAVAKGLVANLGSKKGNKPSAFYTVTDKGVKWLAEQGRAGRRVRPHKGYGVAWTEIEEILLLMMLYDERLSMAQISRRLGRSRCAVASKIARGKFREIVVGMDVKRFRGTGRTWPQIAEARERLAKFDKVLK